MDTTVQVALITTLIPALATAMGVLVNRAYQRSDARRTEMLELLKRQNAELEEENELLRQKLRAARSNELALWRQCVEAGLVPVVDIGGGTHDV